jgi:rhomboid-like protein
VAHLGGAAFGLIYFQYGREVWTWLRRKLGRGAGGVVQA